MATPIVMPASPTVNEAYEAQNGVTYIWDGEKWNAAAPSGGGGGGNGGGASVSVGPNPPATKASGDLWYNSNDGILYVWYVDISQVAASGEGQWVDVRPGNEGA